MKFNKIFLILFIIIVQNEAFSQNLTGSPYSIFGIGEINQKGSSRNSALGGAGIGLKSVTGLNNINPASYSGIDSLFFIYEIGVLTNYSKFSTESDFQDQVICNLSSFALGFQAKKWWGMSFGLAPFSSVGYNISTVHNMENDNNVYSDTYIGSGGLNQIYAGNSFRIAKNITFGLDLSYLMGSLDEDEEISFNGDYTQYTISDKNHVNGFYLDYGLQFDIPLKNYTWTIGAIYGHKRYLNSSTDKTIYDEDDEILYTGENLESNENYIIPRKIGVGFSVVKEDRFTLAMDYTINQWSEIEFSNSDLKTQDSHKMSIGLELTPEGRYSNKLFKSWYYRLGAYYNSSYLKIDNNPINSMAMTFGLGIPINRNLSMFNIAFEIGKNGTLNNQLIQENFYKLNLTMSLQDLWFMKRKFN